MVIQCTFFWVSVVLYDDGYKYVQVCPIYLKAFLWPRINATKITTT